MLAPLRRQDADDLQGDVLDADVLPMGSSSPKSFLDQGLADDADHADVANVVVGEDVAVTSSASCGRRGSRPWCR